MAARAHDRDPIPVYKRVRDAGIKFSRRAQLRRQLDRAQFRAPLSADECDDARLLQEWILNCQGLGITFEIVPVVPSKEPAKSSRRSWMRIAAYPGVEERRDEAIQSPS